MADRFEEFWSLYPRKRDRGHAEKAWRKLDEKTKDIIIKYLANHPFYSVPEKFIPYPATWLNGKRWLDEIPEQSPHWDESQWRKFWKSSIGMDSKQIAEALIKYGFSKTDAERIAGI
ncbi:hypothetical protein L0152_07335 [bacterium]|nr:hypothetical protein [bacterium]